MTEKEIQNTWIQKDEKHGIRQRCLELLRKDYSHADPSIASSKSTKENEKDEETYRGLESYTNHGRRQKHMNRLEAMMLVFEEQQYQKQRFKKNGGSILYKNDEEIAFVYKEISSECQFQAELRAVQDRNEVEREMKKMDSNVSGSNYIERNKTKSEHIKNISNSTVATTANPTAATYSSMIT